MLLLNKYIQSDIGGEFIGVAFLKFLSEKGIRRRLIAPTPHNKMGSQSINMHKSVSKDDVSYIMPGWRHTSATFTINRLPSVTTQKLSLFQILFN